MKMKNEVRLAESLRKCNLKISEEKRRALESIYEHLWIREGGRKIRDPWEVVDDIRIIPVINVEKKNR